MIQWSDQVWPRPSLAGKNRFGRLQTTFHVAKYCRILKEKCGKEENWIHTSKHEIGRKRKNQFLSCRGKKNNVSKNETKVRIKEDVCCTAFSDDKHQFFMLLFRCMNCPCVVLDFLRIVCILESILKMCFRFMHSRLRQCCLWREGGWFS